MRTKRSLLLSAAMLGLCAAWPAPRAAAQKSLVPANVTIWVNRANIEFRVYKNEAAIYEFGRDLAKPYFWPLETSSSKQVTRSWPMRKDGPDESRDHPHQKSAWFTYGDVIPEGMEIKHKREKVEGIDFWSEGAGCGRIICVEAGEGHNDENHAWVTTRNEWRTADGDKIMDEVRKIQFFNYTTARLFIVDIDLRASALPITFGDTKEGAFGVRVADSMREDRGKGRITNAEGKVGEKNCWGRVSAWCDYSGPVDGETVGIAIFAGPNNTIPTAWHSRGYGLMAANPFGRAKSGFPDMKDKKDKKDLVRIEKGKHLKMRYAMLLHLGDVKEGKVAQRYEEFKKIK
ncbi:MAG TPA: PmoA family protein [Gemmataceae bacterium]